MEFHNRTEIERGKVLVAKIDQYIETNGEIPNSCDWSVLESIGFNSDEMDTAYPEIRTVNDSTYELIFVLGFDPPYLMWNSNEKIWKEGFPTIRKK